MKLRDFKTISDRREFLAGKLKVRLDAVSVYPPQLDIAENRNIENMVGAVSVPLGIAGPLTVHGSFADGDYYLPLATTEGALVASVNRGCKALTASGGVTADCRNSGISRGSVFKTEGLARSLKLKDFIENNVSLLQKLAASTSSHLKLKKTKIRIVGNNLFVRFSFDTFEAMGMNMATIAADRLVRFIEEKTGDVCLSVAGNFDNDKKASYLNLLEGRGRSVMAEAFLPAEIIRSHLKTEPEKIHELVRVKCYLGSALSGSFSFNAHHANVLAAMFIALGQDAAHVAEGSSGLTTTELKSNGLYISVTLPDLPLGTVGGGTGLPAQQEALRILGATGGKKGEKTAKLAEIVAGSVLAGEISLLAALSAGELARSHARFTGRKKEPVQTG